MERKTLLLIGSSQVLMSLTKKILERTDYSVRCAIGLAGAREQLMDFTPDAIIVEIDLPDGKGLDYCCELRKKSDIPMMILSNSKEDELLALQAGANDFLKKPYDHDIMAARIDIMLKARAVHAPAADIAENDETKSMAQYWQTIKQNAVAEPIKKKRIPKIRHLYMTAAAGFMLIFGGIGMLNALNNQTPYFDILDEEVPLADLPFQMGDDAQLYIETEQDIEFPNIEDTKITADSVNVTMLLLNPAVNSCYFNFELVLTDTEESLYISDMIEPGTYIEEITLSRGLPKGEYNAYIKIRAYAPEDFTAVSETTAAFKLTAD